MVAGDVKLGAADAGIIWDATATQYPSIDMVAVSEFDAKQNQIAIGVLTSAKDPTRALHFARYLTARDRGLKSFEKHGYRPVEGDKWAETPEISLYCGGLNWLATEPIVKAFQKREGCQVLTRYGGCGQLVGEMQARVGSHDQLPCDAYFACDVTYMEKVQQWFDSPRDVSKVEMVIAVQKGNPKGVKQLSDLARDGMQVGLCNPQLSALGDLAKQLLERHALYEAVRPNLQDEPATAASLVEQVSLQRLDAAIVYRANTAAEENRVDVVEIDDPNVWAVQPVAVSKNSGHKYLSERLMQRLMSADSRPVFEDLKFQWLGETASP
jgi:ABC-type molybdate transport system substrate-binding protein